MSPTILAKLRAFVDGQRIVSLRGEGSAVFSAAFRPHYGCPLRFFIQLQQIEREDW